MRATGIAPPPRLRDVAAKVEAKASGVPEARAEGEAGAEARAGALVRMVGEARTDLSPIAQQRVRRRLKASLVRPAPLRRRGAARFVAAVPALALICGAGLIGSAIGSTMVRWVGRSRGPVEPTTAISDVGAKGPGAARARRKVALERPSEEENASSETPGSNAALPPLEPAPPASPSEASPPSVPLPGSPSGPASMAGSPAPSVPGARRPVRAALPPLAPILAAAPVPSPAAQAAREEAALLAVAMRRLRTDGDGAGTLALLEQRQARFPDGAFGAEASALRVEALLSVGRRADALGALDRLTIGDLPRGDEWRVVRAELRSAAGRWAEAERDFDVAWSALGSASGRDELAERALWGRAAARAWRGADGAKDDRAAARADAETYLRRFPHGRFAAEAARLLASAGGP